MSFGITGERPNSTKAGFCAHSLLKEWDRERQLRGGRAEAGEKPEPSEPRCKKCVDSRAHYRAHGAGCAAGLPPQRWWPHRCSGRRLRAGPCQAAGHGPRPPAVPKHREEPCDTSVTPVPRVTPVPSTAAGPHGQAHPLPAPAHGTSKLLAQRFQCPQDCSIRKCAGVRGPGWRGLGRQAEETAGKALKTAPTMENQSHCKHSPPEHGSTGEGSSWKGRISPGEGTYR